MKLKIVYSNYVNNDRLAVQLFTAGGEPYCTLSSNFVDADNVEPNEFVMKDYSENEAVADAIKRAGLFLNTNKMAASGRVVCPIYKIQGERPTEFNYRG